MNSRIHSDDDTARPEDVNPRYEHETDEFFEMQNIITALFDEPEAAQNAIQELMASNIRKEDISVIAADAVGAEHTALGTPKSEQASERAGKGALVGGVAGLLIGLATLAIPGIGPVLAAGPLASALVGAGLGSATGGLIGVLVDMGLQGEEAHLYAEAIRRGGILVTVQGSDAVTDQVIDILERHNPVDVEERANEWHTEGWTSFDPEAAPYPPDTITEIRDRQEAASIAEIDRAAARH
jgi:uncharacterized membrane protein